MLLAVPAGLSGRGSRVRFPRAGLCGVVQPKLPTPNPALSAPHAPAGPNTAPAGESVRAARSGRGHPGLEPRAPLLPLRN